MPSIACRCGTRVRRPTDLAITRGRCPSCGLVIVFDDIPTLEPDEAEIQPRSVTLDVGSVRTSGGDFLSFSVHVDNVGGVSVLINACEGRRRNLHTLMLTRRDYGSLVELLRKVDATIDRADSAGRRNGGAR